jgi:hypothetical protein
VYEFSQPPGSYVETCTSFYVFSGPRWLTEDKILDPYQIAPSFVHFPTLNVLAPSSLASTHCWQRAHVSVWRNSPSVASTGPIFEQDEIETFQNLTSRRDGRRRCLIMMHGNDARCRWMRGSGAMRMTVQREAKASASKRRKR